MPEVSIIVPTYNRKELLEETVHAILAQTYRDFELIIVDNYSDYDFPEYIKSFNSDKIRAFRNQNHGVIAVNRNFGIKQATGKYIAFCDDDDVWMPEKLEVQVKLLKESFYDLVYSNMILFTAQFLSKNPTNYRNIQNIFVLLRGNEIATSTVIFKKGEFAFFREDPDYTAVEDYDLWLRLMKNGYKFIRIKQPLIMYRVFDTSASRKDKTRMSAKILMVYLSFFINTKVSSIKLKLFILIIIQFQLFKILGFILLNIFKKK